MLEHHGDYIIFVDESGDHRLDKIDQQFPIFTLAFVIFKKEDYIEQVVPKLQRLKIKYWGHDQIILHENDIRKQTGAFGLLRSNKDIRENFYTNLAEILNTIQFRYIAASIRKEGLKERYQNPYNPYELALLFCMERLYDFLEIQSQHNKTTSIIFESRGNKEDQILETEFYKICNNSHPIRDKRYNFSAFNFQFLCVSKLCNSSGLQIADMIARPISLYVLRPEQENRAFAIINKNVWKHKTFP